MPLAGVDPVARLLARVRTSIARYRGDDPGHRAYRLIRAAAIDGESEVIAIATMTMLTRSVGVEHLHRFKFQMSRAEVLQAIDTALDWRAP
ncbi:MAG: hypothetical protein ACHREM_03680 [Polyangiales bacterium]